MFHEIIFHERNELFQQTLIAVELFTIRKSETLETKEIFIFFDTRFETKEFALGSISKAEGKIHKEEERNNKKKGKREEIKGFSVLKSFSRLYQTAEENVKKWRLIKLTEADG